MGCSSDRLETRRFLYPSWNMLYFTPRLVLGPGLVLAGGRFLSSVWR